jgi:DNA-directed RNA polymerase subunit RPC12/RpoP
MKKILLIIAPLIFISMKFNQSEAVKPAKEELLLKEVNYTPAKCTTSLSNNLIITEGAPYVHCDTCGYGVFLGDEGQERCTYCGVKKNYASRK